MIPYGKQDISKEDIKSVIEVLQSDFLTQGSKVPTFERKIRDYCSSSFSTAFNSATSALQIAYQLNGIKYGSIVWTSPLTFVATANAALNLGAKIDFVDISSDTLNICPIKLEKKLKVAKASNKIPDLVVPVHFGGNPCEMDKIYKLSLKYGFNICEDASHALGASFRKEPIGNCAYSNAVVFSFHPVKMITTGEGGALIVKTKNDYKKGTTLRSHGIPEDRSDLSEMGMPDWYYEQISLGYNYRLSDLQAALGVSQLERLKSFVEIRNELALEYHKLLKGLPFKLQKITYKCISSYHLFILQIEDESISRDKLYKYLKSNNIGCQVHYIPVHLQPFFKSKGFKENDFPNAEKYFKKCLTVPLHQGLSKDDIRFVCSKIEDFIG